MFFAAAPVVSAISLTASVGIVLIAYSAVNILYMIVLKKNAKEVEKLVSERKNVAEPAAAVEVEAEAE